MKKAKENTKIMVGLEITYKWNDLGEIIEARRDTLENTIREHKKRSEEIIRNFWKNYKKFGKDYKKYKLV